MLTLTLNPKRRRAMTAGVTLGVTIAVTASLALAPPAFAIRGGTPVNPGEYPFVAEVQLLDKTTDQWEPKCTASLIDTRAVLTAAHCLPGVLPGVRGELRLVFDRVSIHDPLDRVVGEDGIESIIVHPEFGTSSSGDMAVIVLDEPITSIAPVALPSPQDRLDIGDEITAAGWGLIENNAPTDTLRQVRITVTPCPSPFRDNLCAGDGEAGISSGDSGGPGFVPTDDGRFIQYGVARAVTTGAVQTSVYADLTDPNAWEPMRPQLEAVGLDGLIPTPHSTSGAH